MFASSVYAFDAVSEQYGGKTSSDEQGLMAPLERNGETSVVSSRLLCNYTPNELDESFMRILRSHNLLSNVFALFTVE